MAENQKLEELSIVVQDRIRSVGAAWWYALGVALILCIPLYYILRTTFANIIYTSHHFPAYIYTVEIKQPLEIIDKKIFKLSNNTYSGYIKIKNVNLEYGSIDQEYTAVFYTTGGTEITRVSTNTFILPSSEKLIVFSKFTSDKEPTQIDVTLGNTRFIHTPLVRSAPNLELQRVNLQQIDNQFVVSAAVKNKTPFTISKVGLAVLLYNASNNIVGVNFTNINDVHYLETRSFQFTWPTNPGAVRAEILPEVNIFDNNIYTLPPGQSQFDATNTNQ